MGSGNGSVYADQKRSGRIAERGPSSIDHMANHFRIPTPSNGEPTPGTASGLAMEQKIENVPDFLLPRESSREAPPNASAQCLAG